MKHWLLSILILSACTACAKTKTILFMPGKDSHPEGAHEFRAGCYLLAKKLEQSGLDLKVAVHEENKWPSSNRKFEAADAIIVFSDGRHKHRLAADDNRLDYFTDLAKRGKNIAFLHYACELEEEHAHHLHDMMGASYIKGKSTNPIWDLQSILNTAHPISNGVKPFKVKDEWYFNIQFSDKHKITPILEGRPDDEARSGKTSSPKGAVPHIVKASGQKETVMWATKRTDGGRAFGFTGGHYHANWQHDQFRKLVLNAIVWLAGDPVPTDGVDTPTPTDKEMHYLTKKHLKDMEDYKNSQPKFLDPSAFQVPDDLELTVWAKSPQLRNPTNMDIDAKGRIWVTEGVNYRTLAGKDKDGDRITVMTDSTGDGKADKSHTFYQGPELVAPLGIGIVGNQVFVSQPPHLYRFTDVDNDAIFTKGIDKKERFLTGFSGENHDHSLHSLSAGPDGKLYFNCGNGSGYEVTDKSGTTVRGGSWYGDGKRMLGKRSDDGHLYVGGSLFRMNPDGTELEVIAHNFRNAYEHVVNSAGEIYQADNDDTESCRTSWVMLHGNAGFSSADGSRSWRADQRPGQPLPLAHWRQSDPGVMPAGDVYGTGSPAGVEYYENGALPKAYRGMLIVCESARNTLYAYHPKPNKAGFELQRLDLLTSNASKKLSGTDFHGRKEVGELKTWFRPADVTVGPDGALYIADWFDARVGGHQSLDTRATGTVYRLAPKNFSSSIPRFDLSTIEGAITALKSPAKNVRVTGFHALAARGDTAVSAVTKLLGHSDPFIRDRAIWLLPQLASAGKKTTEKLLQSHDTGVRLVAYRALRSVGDNHTEMAADVSPAVRREVALSLRDADKKTTVETIRELAKGFDGLDRAYLEAIGTAATNKEGAVYTALLTDLGSADSATWSDAFAALAWRLHPPEAVAAFKTRALATLPLASREQAVDAIAFVPTEAAAVAMLAIANECSDDLFPLAMHWLKNRRTNNWKAFNLGPAINRIKRTVQVVATATAPSFSVDELKLSEQAIRGRDLYMGRGTCFICHQFGDKGREVGPNLSLIGAKYSGSVIKEAIQNPSSAIVFGYELTNISMKKGVHMQGFVVSDADPLILNDIGGNRHEIPLTEIASRRTSKESIMPSAKMLNLSDTDLDAISRFLIEAAEQQ